MATFLDELRWRGLLADSSPGVSDALSAGRTTAYIGFDPSAPSLHVGSLLPVIALSRFQRFGHSPIAIAGGGTGMIGDPSGKSTERKLLSDEEIDHNLQGIRGQLARFLDFDVSPNPARIINNADWLRSLMLIEFLRDIGKHFSVNAMLARDSVKTRLSAEQGMSFTEFSYALLQAYDFLVLFDRLECTLQMGGSDQWGNILDGADLIRRKRGAKAYGIVFPLVTTAAGTKFGKTEQGTVWLDAQLTSPYDFYQFWLNVDDTDVVRYLKHFTFLDENQILELGQDAKAQPERREAQKALAREVTRLTHGDDALGSAERAGAVLFGQDVAGLRAADLQQAIRGAPSTALPATALDSGGMPIIDLLIRINLSKSRAEARRLVEGGGVYLSNRRVVDPSTRVTRDDAIDGEVLLIRKGRKDYHVIQLVRS